ncbi:MAG: RNA polymerase sigma factor [Planctomycetota bacterium]|nr:MAG: RNA polymerase sigma factor [Planctomycetota bacterium]
MDLTRTSTALLNGLAEPGNERVWSDFAQRYGPILVGFARRLGLDDNDAADVAQETLVRFVEEYRAGKYDRTRGRLRSWMLAIARTKVAGIYRARSVRSEQQGVTRAIDLSDEQALTQIWQSERRQTILRTAMKELRTSTRLNEKTIEAFELLVHGGCPPGVVAEQLGMSIEDVYRAKSRVAQRLREIVSRLEAVYDGEE